MRRLIGAMVAVAAFVDMPASAAVTYANVATGTSIAPFGPLASNPGDPDGTPTYGQVFVPMVAGKVESFTFWLGGNVGKVRGVIGTWSGPYVFAPCDGMLITSCGSPFTLWDSGLIDVAASGAITFTPMTNVALLDQTKYVAYISVYDNPAAAGLTTLELGDYSDSHLNYFAWNDGASDPRGNDTWNYYNQNVGNTHFSITLANVPEPASWALMIGGFGLAGAVARRRRSGVAVAA